MDKGWKSLLPWAGAIAVAWGLGFIYNTYVGGELSWLRRMYTQKLAIAATDETSPRLLITGGSGAHYTLDSDYLAEELGLSVLNLGIDGPVGLNVILDEISKQVRPGDIVLLVPEYLLLLDDDGLGDRSVSFALAIGQPFTGDISLRKLLKDGWLVGVPSLRSLVKSMVDLVNKGKFTGYYDEPLTERGDPQSDRLRQVDWWKLRVPHPITNHALGEIRQFAAVVNERGGTLIVSLPWFYGSQDEKTRNNIRRTAHSLAQIVPLIYEEYSLNIQSDETLFADTHYHLRPVGRRLRSQQLVEQLRPVIAPILEEETQS
ncbi:MAG: hypothetical protein AAGG02_12510 [Cyanobacteria bacterium P01_H01_bin.15]